MNYSHAILGIKKFGLIGLCNWLKRIVFGSEFNRNLLRTKIKGHNHRPSPGISIIGDFSLQNGSLCKVLADFASALQRAGIHYQTYDTSNPKRSASFAINKYTHVVGMLNDPITQKLPFCKSYRIAFWEFESGLLSYYPQFTEGSPIICFSDFCRDSFRLQVPNSVLTHKILYPFHFKPGNLIDPDTIRAKYQIPSSDFCAFFNFDYHSGLNRKNPEAVIRAFAKAFQGHDDVKLILKTMRAKMHVDSARRIHELAYELGLDNKLIDISTFIPNDELFGLTNACDAYISLHRGEGFGLGIAEAMSLGKPVIVSDYSATTEFCKPDNSILIPCRMVQPDPSQMDVPYFKNVKLWAEPDVEAAAMALKKLYEDKTYRLQLGQKGKAFIESYFSIDNFKKSVENFLAS